MQRGGSLFRNCCGFRASVSSISLRLFSAHTASKLEGKVALITGAARGIGKETATKFINNGAKVVLTDILADEGHEVARELGPNAAFIPCNTASEHDVSNAVDFAILRHGQLDIMYNNAGIACHTPPSIVDLDLATFDRIMAINVRGIVAGIKHGARVMIPRQCGTILCTASVTGIMGGLAQHTYSISKCCVIGIVRSAAAELGVHGVRINCISPMAVPTAFVMEDLKSYYPGVDQVRLERMIYDLSPLKGAICEPSDVANAAVYLASDDAKFVSGHNLVVDGGFTTFKSLNLPRPDQF